MNKAGIYLHIPFCAGKCAYCDFYSTGGDERQYDIYTDALRKRIALFGERFPRSVDSVYFGGGTPSLLGGKRIAELLNEVKNSFKLSDSAEITLEANPADGLRNTLELAADAGVNRLSLGVQSSSEEELKYLGRRHTNADVFRTVDDARAVGISNISLDLMLGIPKQSEASLKDSIGFLLSLSPSHISAYMLKLEPGTAFYRRADSLPLPSSDQTADMYLLAVERLAEAGLKQYEISNFAVEGCASRHNLKYWQLDEYIGIGPAAHSFINGKRFRFSRNTEAFINGEQPIEDGEGGGVAEYLMLGLRLTEGISEKALAEKYRVSPNENFKRLCDRLCEVEYAVKTENGIALTPSGMLVQNEITLELAESLGIEY